MSSKCLITPHPKCLQWVWLQELYSGLTVTSTNLKVLWAVVENMWWLLITAKWQICRFSMPTQVSVKKLFVYFFITSLLCSIFFIVKAFGHFCEALKFSFEIENSQNTSYMLVAGVEFSICNEDVKLATLLIIRVINQSVLLLLNWWHFGYCVHVYWSSLPCA